MLYIARFSIFDNPDASKEDNLTLTEMHHSLQDTKKTLSGTLWIFRPHSLSLEYFLRCTWWSDFLNSTLFQLRSTRNIDTQNITINIERPGCRAGAFAHHIQDSHIPFLGYFINIPPPPPYLSLWLIFLFCCQSSFSPQIFNKWQVRMPHF